MEIAESYAQEFGLEKETADRSPPFETVSRNNN
jgi:hypothetical protein